VKTLRMVLLALMAVGAGLLATASVVSSQQGPTVSIESGEVAEGGTEMTRLWALDVNDPPLCGFTIDVVYDPLVKIATGCVPDPEGDFGVRLCNPDYASDTVRVVGANFEGLTGAIPLADITWRAVGRAGDSTDLDVQIVDFVDCQIPAVDITPVADQDSVNVIIGPSLAPGAPPSTGAGGSAGGSKSPWSTLCAAGGALILLLGGMSALAFAARRRWVK
jgi:hypothetical protein